MEKFPIIASILPLEAGMGDTVAIIGKNFRVTDSVPEISVNNKTLTVIKATSDTVLIKVPKLLGSGKLVLSVGAKRMRDLSLRISIRLL